MELVVVKSAGFCFGVKRAVKMAVKAAEKYNGEKIFTIGPIIHNNSVVNELKNKSIFPLKEDEAEEVKNSVVILRSHGVKKNLLEKLKNNKNIIIDAICPFVKKIHDYVLTLKKEGYFIVIIGDKNHPEVLAISSYADENNSIVISSPDEAKKIKKSKTGVVVQTTQDLDNFLNIISELVKNKGEIRIYNSICNATSIRQKESITVAKEVDTIIVIGGKHSANTRRLYEICKNVNKNTFHIENKEELKKEWFENANTIGITAGASTPQDVINEVIIKIKKISRDST